MMQQYCHARTGEHKAKYDKLGSRTKTESGCCSWLRGSWHRAVSDASEKTLYGNIVFRCLSVIGTLVRTCIPPCGSTSMLVTAIRFPQTPVFGQPTQRNCDLVDSSICNANGRRDFGQ